MLDIIETDGWCRSRTGLATGPVCLIGAVGKAVTGIPKTGYDLIDSVIPDPTGLCADLCDRLIVAIVNQTGLERPGRGSIPLWRFNDCYAKSVDDVKSVLQEVINQKT